MGASSSMCFVMLADLVLSVFPLLNFEEISVYVFYASYVMDSVNDHVPGSLIVHFENGVWYVDSEVGVVHSLCVVMIVVPARDVDHAVSFVTFVVLGSGIVHLLSDVMIVDLVFVVAHFVGSVKLSVLWIGAVHSMIGMMQTEPVIDVALAAIGVKFVRSTLGDLYLVSDVNPVDPASLDES